MQLPFVKGFLPGVGLYPVQQRPFDFIFGFIFGFIFDLVFGFIFGLGFVTLGIYTK